MKLGIKAAGSLVLSLLASSLSAFAFLLAYFVRTDLAIVLWWVVLPPLFVVSSGYLLLDLMRPNTRKQAAVAVLLVLPAIGTEVWFFSNLHL